MPESHALDMTVWRYLNAVNTVENYMTSSCFLLASKDLPRAYFQMNIYFVLAVNLFFPESQALDITIKRLLNTVNAVENHMNFRCKDLPRLCARVKSF